MSGAGVAIVGCGVVGASIAYHLAAAGVRDVLVLDRGDAPGSGSTSRATGGFRAQFHTAVNVRLSLLSRAKLTSFRDEIGVDPGYDPAGYLWVASSEAELDALRAAQAVQHAEGLLEAIEIAADDVPRINAAISLAGVAGAAFCPTDGYINPMSILRGYVAAAERLGARFEWGATVLSMTRNSRGAVSRVQTARGDVDVDVVVNAAGAWSAGIAALAGVDLPVAPLRRQVAVSEPGDFLPARMPMTIFTRDGFHLRRRDDRAVLCWPTPGDARDPFDTTVDAEWLEQVSAKARERLPPLRHVELRMDACYAGLYEMSPDSHAILGAAPGCANMFLANGSSGHGVMHSPALGQILAELITGAAPACDVRELRPTRFAEGAANPPSLLL